MIAEESVLAGWLTGSSAQVRFWVPWLVGALLGLGVIAIIALLRRLVMRRLAPLAARPAWHWNDLLIDLTWRTSRPFVYSLGLAASAAIWPLTPRAAQAFDRLLVISLAAQAGLWGTGLVRYAVFTLMQQSTIGADASYQSIRNLVRSLGLVLLWGCVLLICLDNLGVQVTTLVTGLGFTGVALGFATQNILPDLFASLAIVMDQPFLVGDFISLGTAMGTVERIGIKTTRLRSISGEEIVCANSELIKIRIQNFRSLRERRVLFNLGLRGDGPAQRASQAVDIIREVVSATTDVRLDRAHLSCLEQGIWTYEVVYYVYGADYAFYMDRHHHILTTLLGRLEAVDLHLAYPTRWLVSPPKLAAP